MSKQLIAYYDEQDNLCFSSDYYEYYGDLQEDLKRQEDINETDDNNLQ